MINKEINSGKISKQKIISGLKNFKTNNSRGLKRNYWYPLMSPTYDEKEIMQALHSMITFNTTMFDKTKKFEKKFSIFNKSKYSVMVNSGSSADLLISFTLVDKLLKILKKGDEIIIPVLTWPTHIWSAIMAGLKVKLIDINPDNLNIDINEIKLMIRDVVRDTVRDVVREELKDAGMLVESTQNTNEVIQFKVGQHLFIGKVTKIKKLEK
jgi:hypothetical protein